MSIFRYFLFFPAQKRTWNYNLVDDCIVLFTQEGCNVVLGTWHRSCWYLASKKKLIYNELIWHFLYSYLIVFLGVTYRHKLKHSLLGVPRKMVLLKFESKEKWVILMKASANWIIMFLFTIPHEVVCKHFAYFLGTANLRNNSLLVRTISIVCTIPCQRLFVPNLILIGVVLERSLEENSCSESFYKTGEVINEGFTS